MLMLKGHFYLAALSEWRKVTELADVSLGKVPFFFFGQSHKHL